MPSYTVTDPQSGKKVTLTGDSPPTEKELEQIFASVGVRQPQEPSTLEKIGGYAKDTAKDAYLTAAEAAAAVNRGAVDFVDLLGSVVRDPANMALQGLGSDYRIGTLREGLKGTPMNVEGGYMQNGLPKQIVRQAGELALPAAGMGGAIRKAATMATPAIASTLPTGFTEVVPLMANPNANAVLPNVGRLLQQGSVATDLTMGAASGAGAATGKEYGGDTGEIIGGILAPFGAAGITGGLKGAKSMAKEAFDNWKNPKPMAPAGAVSERNRILTEAVQRSGMSANEIQAELSKLGDNATMADLSPAFSRQLRAAMNESPQLEGEIAKSFGERSKGSYGRIQSAVASSLGKGETVDDAINSVESATNPKMNELYKIVRETPFAPSERLRTILDGDNPLGQAFKEAQSNLTTRRLMGEQVGNMAVVDETKKVLDGRIGEAVRSGNKSKVRDLTMLKNYMVGEADKAAPEWAAARSLFAGKQALKDAADLGQDFYKLGTGEVQSLSDGFGESEKHFFKLGAQEAILKKIDEVGITSDAAKAIIGKNGSIKKLRPLFGNEDELNQFVSTVEREAKFKATANAVFGNSNTAKQAADMGKLKENADMALEAVSSPTGAARVIGNLMGKLGAKKGSDDFKEGLYQAGLILSEKGLDNKVLFKMLKNQESEQLKKALQQSVTVQKPITKAGAISASLVGSQQENTKQAKQQQR